MRRKVKGKQRSNQTIATIIFLWKRTTKRSLKKPAFPHKRAYHTFILLKDFQLIALLIQKIR